MDPIWRTIILNLFFVIIFYLYSSLNLSIIISKRSKVGLITKIGSKNPGTTNFLRFFDKKLGFLVFLFDFSKGFFAFVIPVLLVFTSKFFVILNPVIISFFSVLGHCFPVFYKFKGGKGVATFAGVLTGLNFLLGIIFGVCFYFLKKILKIVAFSSVLTTFICVGLIFVPWFNSGFVSVLKLFNIIFNDLYKNLSLILYIILSFLILIKHSSNFRSFLREKKYKN